MSRHDDSNGFAFERPGKYRILVLGLLSEHWSNRLGSFQIATRDTENSKGPITELVGNVRDQAELVGILDTLYDLHMTIMLVEFQDE